MLNRIKILFNLRAKFSLCLVLAVIMGAGGIALKELLEIIAKNLVDDPDSVVVKEIDGEKATVLELKVAQEDMGKVIGKQGRIAKAIRNVIKAAAIHNDKRVVVEIVQ